MTTRTIMTAAALTLTLLASAPAMAGPALDCRAILAGEVHGDDPHIDARARDCAYWGFVANDDDARLTGTVAGPGTRAVSIVDGGGRTHLDVRGIGASVFTKASSGSGVRVLNRGDTSVIARADHGSFTEVRSFGHGGYIRAEAY